MSEAPSYELLRSKRKTLALEITADCRVLVRAPLRLSQKRAGTAIRSPRRRSGRTASAGPGTICRGGWSSTPA